MTGYKRARLGQLNRLVALKNKFSSHKGRQNLVVGSKFINGINVSKKLESLLGQSTCTSYPDSRIKSILCSVDLIKNDYLRNELHRKEPCETLNSEIYSYIPKGQKVPSDMSSLSRPQSVSIHLPLLVKQDKFYNVVTDDDNHPKLVEYDFSDDDN